MIAGERQIAPTLDGIRRDHVARYEWAAKRMDSHSRVIDFACGIGYGARLLADAGHSVVAFDNNEEALAYAAEHYPHFQVQHRLLDANGIAEDALPHVDVALCFETIEHIEDPRPLLLALRMAAPILYASVPNETSFPYANHAFHFRHYTRSEFIALLAECGWEATTFRFQVGPESEVEPSMTGAGRTICAVCRRAAIRTVAVESPKPVPMKPALGHRTNPKHVAVLGLGPSLDQYTNIVKRVGGRSQYCDETWGINALGDVFAVDRVFHMDDVRIQEVRAAAKPDSNIAAMLGWMKTTAVPIITSRPHPDYPATSAFPLEQVLNEFQYAYFNSTAAYAVAYAVWLGVEKLSLFGCDFTYPDAHDAEKGRACVEFWLGIAVERGIKIVVPKNSTLLDAMNTQRERFYGYDTLDIGVAPAADGKFTVSFSERPAEELPTAAEVEAAYDHDVHPNGLMVAIEEA